jgi:hypothetical protein
MQIYTDFRLQIYIKCCDVVIKDLFVSGLYSFISMAQRYVVETIAVLINFRYDKVPMNMLRGCWRN